MGKMFVLYFIYDMHVCLIFYIVDNLVCRVSAYAQKTRLSNSCII